MAVSTNHVLHGIKNNNLFLSQVSNAQVTPGIATEFVRSAGFHLPLAVVARGVAPAVTFDTEQIGTLLTATGANLVSLIGNTTYLYFKKTTILSTREADATTTHTRLASTYTGLCWNRITAGHQTVARASAMLPIIYDGTNAPIVATGSLALAGTPTAAEQYFAGPLVINGTTYNGVQDLTIDLGMSVRFKGGDGELYPTFAFEAESFPVITARVSDLSWATIGLGGLTTTTFSCYLRRGSDVGRVANGTSSHISFTGTTGKAEIVSTSGGNNDDAETTVRISCVAASVSVQPLIVTVGTTIA